MEWKKWQVVDFPCDPIAAKESPCNIYAQRVLVRPQLFIGQNKHHKPKSKLVSFRHLSSIYVTQLKLLNRGLLSVIQLIVLRRMFSELFKC